MQERLAPPLPNLKMGMGQRRKECCHPAEPGQGKQTDYPLQPPKENPVPWTP